jgi:hypothetical protein
MINVRSQDGEKLVNCTGFYIEEVTRAVSPNYIIKGIVPGAKDPFLLGEYLCKEHAIATLYLMESRIAKSGTAIFYMPQKNHWNSIVGED